MEEHTPCQCDVCKVRHFERNHYFAGKMLNARDLAAEQAYFNEKRWLVNRMVLGWGIVCGLDVCVDGCGLTIRPGLALDCCGHELLVCDRRSLPVEKFVEVLGDGGEEHESARWVLCLEYRERHVEPCDPDPGCHGEGRGGKFNRIRDDYTLRILPWKKACPDDQTDDCCPYEGLGRQTPLHKALVERSEHCPKCKDCECVILATGRLVTHCDPPEIRIDDDSWKYRRIVYTNSTLAGVIRCLHDGLPHITAINWKPDSRIRLDEFLDWLRKDRLKVTFDQKLKTRTVTNRRSCRLTFFHTPDCECPVPLIIPVERISYDEDTSTATYYFDDDCVEQELRKVCKKVRKPAEVELVLHGNMIHNHHGRALDAELIDELPSGNGVEGGDFTAFFTVEP